MSLLSTSNARADRAILIVGAPRSGTTWLAKILDSHPDTLYRHEPDEVAPAGVSMCESMARWTTQTDARTAGKRPFFQKSWQSTPARWIRTGLAYGGAAACRMGLRSWHVPDLGAIALARPVIKSVRLSAEIGDFAAECPDGRALFIARHPCGQVASVMRGTGGGRFALATAGTDMPFDEAATIAFAARHGVDEPAFQALPDAAKYAWSWRCFNTTALAGIANRPNARVIVYEELCAGPIKTARAILAFAGLDWNARTEAFLNRSTTDGDSTGYYAVTRDSIAAADKWRTSMSAADQAAVRAAVAGSPLCRFWPDLA